MAKIRVRYNSDWQDLCGCRKRLGNLWTGPFKQGDRIFYNGSWVILDCDEDIPVIPCGSQAAYNGGESFPTTIAVTLGTGQGLFDFNGDALDVPDRFVIRRANSDILLDTGYRGNNTYQTELNTALTNKGVPLSPETNIKGLGQVSVQIDKNFADSVVYIDVYAPIVNTAWNFNLTCPENPNPPDPPEQTYPFNLGKGDTSQAAYDTYVGGQAITVYADINALLLNITKLYTTALGTTYVEDKYYSDGTHINNDPAQAVCFIRTLNGLIVEANCQ